MQVGNAWLEVNELHSNCQVKSITPSEAMILRKQFGVKITGQSKPSNPLTHLEVLKGEVERTGEQEYDRLSKKFGSKVVSECFPGESPKMPSTFEEYLGKDVKLPLAPEKGKDIEIAPIESLKKGDNGADLEAANNQAQELADLKAQVAVLIAANKLKEVEGNVEPKK